MGDFNLTQDSEPVKILSKNLDDTFYHSKTPHYGPIGTFQAFDVNKPAKDRIERLKESIRAETGYSQKNFLMSTMQLNMYLLRRLQDEKAKALQSSKN